MADTVLVVALCLPGVSLIIWALASVGGAH
jgi:hypothetical protein